jgi:predicted metal-dependent hydrolase
MERQIEISGRTYSVIRVTSDNRNAIARLRNSSIIISIPHRWPKKEADEIAEKLERRAIRSIERGTWGARAMKELEFRPGQEIEALGRKFRITDASKPDRIRKGIARRVLPDLEARIRKINDTHFRADLRRVSLRDNSSRWGSYSPKGAVHLNFRLLFAPPEILEYVIVHELAHSRYRGHGPRFWGTVERVVPDYKEKRKWLREKGHTLGPAAVQI